MATMVTLTGICYETRFKLVVTVCNVLPTAGLLDLAGGLL